MYSPAQKILSKYLVASNNPLSIQLDITNSCNLSCNHCYHSHHRNIGALKAAGWTDILSQYQDLLCKLDCPPSIILCGGEPLVSSNLQHTLRQVSLRFGSSVPLSVLTNGTYVPDQVLELFSEFRKVHFQVSFDGPDEARHDEIRGKGSFNKAICGLRKIVQKRHRVSAQFTLSHRTSKWINDFFEFGKKEKIPAVNFVRFVPSGVGLKSKQSGIDRELTSAELKEAYKKILIGSVVQGVETNFTSPLFHLIHPSLGHYGHFGRSLVVDYMGNLKVSSRTDHVIGNIQKNGLANLYLNDPVLRSLRSGKIWGCENCEDLAVCGGDRNLAYAKYGDFLAPDPGCWKDENRNIKENYNEAI